MNARGQRLRDLRRGDDGRERTAIADPFGHGHNVRDDTLRFESPVMRAGAAEARLNFIRDANTAGGANVFVSVPQIAVRKHDGAADALNALGDEPRDLTGGAELNEI